MGIKISIDKSVQDTLGVKVVNNKIVVEPKNSSLIKDVRREFSKGPNLTIIRKSLLRDMTKGISPVEGKGKYKPYSKGYKDQITRGTSFVIGGASPKKRISPVTLRLSGQLHRSLKLFTKGGFGSTFKLFFDWRDFLADIHNRRGAGKSKVVRRMLPTESGEQFNKEINDTILERLKHAVSEVVKRLT